MKKNSSIIDFHVHPRHVEEPFAEMEKMLEAAEGLGIEKIVLLGDVLRFGWTPSEEQIAGINTCTIRLVRRWPEKLIGFCFLNPLHKEEFWKAEVERCVDAEGFKGIKLEVAVNARHPLTRPIAAEAGKRGLVIVHHCWDTTIVGKRKHQSDPSDVAALAARFPEVKFVVAHLTGIGMRGVQEIKKLGNVSVDTSGSQPLAGMVEYAVAELGPERVIFGSDAPGRDFSSQLGRIYGAKIKEGERNEKQSAGGEVWF